MRRRRGDDGFTLIELLVVVAIIGILAGIAIPVYLAQRRKAYKSAASADMKNAALAVETFASENSGGSYLGADGATEASPILQGEGYNPANWSSFIVYANNTEFCIKGTHLHIPTLEVVYRNSTGIVEIGDPGAVPCTPYPP